MGQCYFSVETMKLGCHFTNRGPLTTLHQYLWNHNRSTGGSRFIRICLNRNWPSYVRHLNPCCVILQTYIIQNSPRRIFTCFFLFGLRGDRCRPTESKDAKVLSPLQSSTSGCVPKVTHCTENAQERAHTWVSGERIRSSYAPKKSHRLVLSNIPSKELKQVFVSKYK